MEHSQRINHWQNIYQNKKIDEVSWYQKRPSTSLDLIGRFNLSKNASIIDVGGGDSFLVDYLLEMGYEDITVLDISENAIQRAQDRLGEKSEKVSWIVTDAAHFQPKKKYDLWHDRAAFHFLTDELDIKAYKQAVQNGLSENGVLVLGTFSKNGPLKCSGIEIQQYSESTLTEHFAPFLKKDHCILVDHETPFDTIQNFIFCTFMK